MNQSEIFQLKVCQRYFFLINSQTKNSNIYCKFQIEVGILLLWNQGF